MRRGFLSLIAIVISLLIFTILFIVVFNKMQISPISQLGADPRKETQETIDKVIEQQNKEKIEFEQMDEKDQKLLGVQTGKNYTALVYDLGSSTVVTDTAGDNDCANDCFTKPLASYVKEQGGRGGMNGTYFCPPDYSWCAGKKNSFDFPVWNNRQKKWIQAEKLFWNGRGMMVFRPGSAQFFANSAAVGAPSDITGGIINYPSLLAGGSLLVNDGNLVANLKTKATRTGIGFGKGKLFLVVARNSSVMDLANTFISLGATDALNLDGGGSAALYEGRYKAGPGRSLPNAIIVK